MTAIGTLRAVMLVDDEEIDQMMYRRVIARSGLVGKVYSFRYAEQALDFLRDPSQAPVDVIFLDINMPRMSGFDFLERATAEFGAEFAGAVVVMLTTSMDPHDFERAKSFAAVKLYVNKPLTIEHLRQVVEIVSGSGSAARGRPD